MRTKFIVWVKERGEEWAPNGDGPMTEKTAERVAKEIRKYCGARAVALAEGNEPLR